MAYHDYSRARSSSRDDRQSYDPDEYERGRQRIDLKLKGTFERIFEKYAKDFTGVGDEIDMETGEIVVNNGHLAYMQHERDTGKSASSRFVRAFADELEVEDGDEDNYDDAGGADSQDEDDEQEEDISDQEDPGYEDAADEAGDERSGDETDDLGRDQDEFPLDPRLAHSDPHAHVSQEQEQYHFNTSVIPSTEISHSSLPQISIADSLNQLVPHQDAQGRVDPEAIHHLGQSIANQIAQFLMHATSINRHPQLPVQSHGVWAAPPLPQDSFSSPYYFHPRPDALTPAPQRAPSVWDSPSGGQSLWASAASRPKKRRRLLKQTKTSFNIDPALADDAAFSDAASTRRNIYSREEDDLIKRLKEINGLTWQQITAQMPGRTIGGISGRYTRVLKERPVMIEREVIEIMGDDDDELSTPGPPHTGQSPGMSPFRTPLLRRAMDKQIARHGDTGDIPITIGDEDGDTDSQRESSGPIYLSDTPETDAPHRGMKKRSKKKHGSLLRGNAGFYRTFDTTDPAVGSFGVLCTDNPAPFEAEEHNLNIFGPTSGFGVLRIDKPTSSQKNKTSRAKEHRKSDAFEKTQPMPLSSEKFRETESDQSSAPRYTYPAPQLRDRLARTPGSTINLFARAEQYLRAKGLVAAGMATTHIRAMSALQEDHRSNPAAARSSNLGESVNMAPPAPTRPHLDIMLEGSSPIHPAHPPPPYSANPPARAEIPFEETPSAETRLSPRTEPMIVDTENDGDVSDSPTMDTPAPAIRYTDTPHKTTHSNGPYFLSNLPPPPSPLHVAPQVQMRSPSSSPLSSPLSSPPPRPSSPNSQDRPTRNPTRQAIDRSGLTSKPLVLGKTANKGLPTPKSATKKGKSATPKTPFVRHGTPVRETVGRKEILRKRALAFVDDGSEDELA